MAFSFLFGGDTGETPESIRRKRELAMAIMGASGAPKNVGEGLNALGSGIVAGVMNRRADKAEKTGRSAATDLFNRIIGQTPNVSAPDMLSPGVKPSPVASRRDAPNVGSTIDFARGEAGGGYRNAIAGIESGGRYDAVGPTHPKLGRAIGKYQIMEANIPQWSREALGREVSTDEFLSSPEIQDAIFDHKFNGYVQQFGPEGAAQAWFAGPGGVGKVNRKDSLGTTVGEYGSKFMNALGPQQQPQQVASLDPSIGIPSARPQPSAPAQAPVAAPAQPSLSDEVAAFKQTPEYQAQFPGQNVGWPT